MLLFAFLFMPAEGDLWATGVDFWLGVWGWHGRDPTEFSQCLNGPSCGFFLCSRTPCPCLVFPALSSPAVVAGMAFTPLKLLCTGKRLCGCWLQPQCFRAWFQPCLWRPIFNIQTKQHKWNLYYLLKMQVNRAEDPASRKPLGFVQGITTNISHPFWDSRQPQEMSAEDSCWNTPGCLAEGYFWDCCVRNYLPSPNILHWLKVLSNFESQAGLLKHLDSIFFATEAQYFQCGWWWSRAIRAKAFISSACANLGKPKGK